MMDIVPQTPYQRLSRLRNDPQLRLNSFLNWPPSAHVTPQDLCNDGFYYTGLEDRVQCTHCGGILSSWEPGDIVANEHNTHFPQCPWVVSRRNNRLFQSTAQLQCGRINICDSGFTFGHPSSPNVPLQYQAPTHPGDVPGTNRPKYPEYALESNRLATFKGWPTQLSQKPAALAKGGFFYLGQGDRCKCFYCGGILFDWDYGDDIWTEHAKWFKDCPWIKLSKGEPFIRQVQLELQQSQSQAMVSNADHVQMESNRSSLGVLSVSATPTTDQGGPSSSGPSSSGMSSGMPPLGSADSDQTARKTVDVLPSVTSTSSTAEQTSNPTTSGQISSGPGSLVPSMAQSATASGSNEVSSDIKSIIEENQKLKDERTCKICMDEEVSILFLPCGHMACCAGCSVSVNDCPICRTDIVQRVKAYWSL